MDEELSTDVFRSWHINYEEGTARIVLQDGRTFDSDLDPGTAAQNSQMATSTFDWEKWWIISTTTRGDLIITEGFNPNSPPHLGDQRTAYLDQNRWRTISDALHDPERIANPLERQAALDLIELANDAGVILPLSIGHMLKTAGLNGERRYELGISMAKLSYGWEIREPLDMWKHEAESTIREHLGIPQGRTLYPIVTEPGALFGADTSLGISPNSSDADILRAMLTMPSVILSMLIEPERLPKHPQTKWIDHHTRITSQINAEGLPKERRRQVARRRYWNENIGFYTAPYYEFTHSPNFPTFSDRELARLLSASPMVGLLSEVFVRRFTDRQVKWRRNDLIDIFHLSNGAAYADYVCAETYTGTQLRQAQRALGRKETVYTSLNELVIALRQDGTKTETERQALLTQANNNPS